MHVKTFKTNEVSIVSKIVLTKSEAIALCKRGKQTVRKEFLKRVVEKLLEIDDVGKNVSEEERISPPIYKIDFTKMHEESKI